MHLPRLNELDRQQESWRPPLFRPVRTLRDRLAAAVRRFLDLQGGTIWRDLRTLLAECQGTVLDVGCGAQPYRSLLPPKVSYIGIDDAEAPERFGYEMPDTLYFEGARWPVATGSVDVVLSTETLEHVPDPSGFLAEASRCLRRGGRLILTVPFSARWHFLPFDYWRFTPSGLGTLLSGAGFDSIAVYARGNAVTVACYKLMAVPLACLLPRTGPTWRRVLILGIGLACLPAVFLIAAVANLSLMFPGGADCLGYTAVARRVDSPH